MSNRPGCRNGSPPRMPKNELPCCLRFADHAVDVRGLEPPGGAVHVHPAALAAQVAGRGDREEQERREVLAALQPPLVPFDRPDALHAARVGDLRQQAGIDFGHEAERELGNHDRLFRGGRRRWDGSAVATLLQRRNVGPRANRSACLPRSWRTFSVSPLRSSGLVDLDRLGRLACLQFAAVDRGVRVLRKDDGRRRTHPRARRATVLAVGGVAHLHRAVGVHGVDAEQAEVEALLAVLAALAVDDGEPRLPHRARQGRAGLVRQSRRRPSGLQR